MKRFLALAPAVFLIVGTAFAQDPPKQTDPQPDPYKQKSSTSATAAKAKEVSGEVVSVNADAKTITVKDDAMGQEKTFTVEGKALTSLKTLNAGEKVKLTCRTDSTTGKESVTAIDKAAATTPKD